MLPKIENITQATNTKCLTSQQRVVISTVDISTKEKLSHLQFMIHLIFTNCHQNNIESSNNLCFTTT